MDILLKIVLVIVAFKAVVVLFLLVGAIIAWLNGAPAILLPGLGLVITTQLIVILLLMVEIFLIAIATLIWRYIAKTRLQ
ncbi:MAG TPA: hypothetical protein VNI60_03470 [Pyrinomonadaceae bacterium]|nr:hypothetical protein [Pyrinomonadaceae bacterium]